MAPKGSSNPRSLYFIGQRLESSISADDLRALRRMYNIPKLVVLKVPRRRIAAMDFDGMDSWVALYLLMFVIGLRLPFCRPIHDVLNFLGLAPAQLHTYA